MRSALAGVAALAAACASVPAGDGMPADPSARASAARESETGSGANVGRSHGTLRQDDVTVTMRTGPLLLKVTPLADEVTELLAPDTQQRLSALADSHRAAAENVAFAPAAFLVSFFSYEADAVYRIEDVQLAQLGRVLRPVSILPVTTGFGTQRLGSQETQLAVYVYDHAIDYDQPLTVRYGTEHSDAWSRIIPRLEVERARVRARAGH